MPIEIAIWKLGSEPERVAFSTIESEARLEEVLVKDVTMVSPDLMFLGSQVSTDYGKFIDVLAMDQEGNVHVIELKRDRTPRDVVAQLLDYASWVDSLTYEQLANLYAEQHSGKQLEEGFAECFDTSPPEKLNESHNLIVVCI